MKTSLNHFLIMLACLCLFSCKKDKTADNTPHVYVPPLTILSKTIELGDACEYSTYPYCMFAKMKDSSYTMVYNNCLYVDKCFNVVNYSKNGILNWHKKIPYNYFRCISFDTTAEGGYLVHMCPQNNFYPYEEWSTVMKLNQQGDSVWTKNFTNRKLGNAKALSNGEICLASIKNYRPYILFLNSDGDSLRSAYIADTIVTSEFGYYVGIDSRLTENNGLIFFVIYTESDDPGIGPSYTCIIKTDYSGNVIWKKTIPYGFSDVNMNSDGSILCLYGDIINISPEADITGIIDVSTGGSAVVKMDDGSYLVAYTKLSKVDASGNILWSQNFLPDMGANSIKCHKLVNNGDDTYTMFGYYGSNDYWTAIVIRFRIA